MEIAVLFWLLFGIASATIASSRGRNGCSWFLVGILFGPFGLVVAALPPINRTTKPARHERPCPFCAEAILAAAVVCRYCGRDVPAAPVSLPPEPSWQPPKKLTASDVAWQAAIWFVVILALITGALVVANNTGPSPVPPPVVESSFDNSNFVANLESVGVANIRSGPGMRFPVVRQTEPGERLVQIGKVGEWYQVRGPTPADNLWIHKSVVVDTEWP